MDFTLPRRPVSLSLVSGRGHYETVVTAVMAARTSVWIATANLKSLMVEGTRRTYRSIASVFSDLARKRVELRILHAGMPSRAFRREFDRHPRLVRGGLDLRVCPRVHLKVVIVDGALLYLGSANWTGAGLGAKGAGRRNFELGVVTDDDLVLDEVQAVYDGIWTGKACKGCKLRDVCPAPLDET
jgi:phosphatidylserine/phosphatidylglycerophosphate/cardiolipin synthase-like enzyme